MRKVRGLELGGDDYITKPFSIRELIQRVRNVRSSDWYRSSPAQGNVLRIGKSRVDLSAYTAETPEGNVELTQKECMILKLLVEREGKVVTRDKMKKVWGYDRYPSTRTIDNLMVRLRKFLEDDPKNPSRRPGTDLSWLAPGRTGFCRRPLADERFGCRNNPRDPNRPQIDASFSEKAVCRGDRGAGSVCAHLQTRVVRQNRTRIHFHAKTQRRLVSTDGN